MADPTETVSDGASREADDGHEWLPPQIEQELRRPFFTRLTTNERMQRRSRRDRTAPPKRTRRFAPSPGKIVATAPRKPVKSRKPVAPREPVAPRPPVVAPEPLGSEMLRRLSEVEARVASAARAVDRSASTVRTLVQSNGKSG